MSHVRTLPIALTALAACCAPALAQTPAPADASRIDAVTLYPGSATVERLLRVTAGSRSATFACLPAQLDARSLQVSGGAAVRIGDINLRTIDRALASGCTSPLDERIRAAEDEVARARAEADALELAQTWLKTQAGSAPAQAAAGPTPAQISATTDALRRGAQDTLVRLHQARRHQQDLELALKRLVAERGGSAQAARVAVVRVTLVAQADAELRLSYQVRGPSWSPGYRAALDSRGPRVQLERLALVAQATGEDWSGVALTLSTGQPLAATRGRLPRPWTLDTQPAEPPVVAKREAEFARGALLAAPAPAPASAEPETAPPSFDAVATEGSYATTFAVPQRVNLPSGGERVTLSLGAQTVPVTLLARTTPALESAAYLVAALPPLPGVWPAGPVALERDGAHVGQGQFDPAASDFARLGLAFGRDERITVRAEPVKDFTASGGFTGARSERTLERGYQVDNRHERAVVLQVLDAAPVSLDERIGVQSSYEPAPVDRAWGGQPGTIAWQQELAAGASARFTSRHVISHAKDVRVREQR